MNKLRNLMTGTSPFLRIAQAVAGMPFALLIR